MKGCELIGWVDRHNNHKRTRNIGRSISKNRRSKNENESSHATLTRIGRHNIAITGGRKCGNGPIHRRPILHIKRSFSQGFVHLGSIIIPCIRGDRCADAPPNTTQEMTNHKDIRDDQYHPEHPGLQPKIDFKIILLFC